MSAPPLLPGVPGDVTAPRQTLLPDLRRFRLADDASYTWRHTPEGGAEGVYRLVVPAGFEHDFASVPRPLWALVAPIDLGIASIFHDWLYARAGRAETLRWAGRTPGAGWEPVPKWWTRRDADRLFARLMREQGVPRWRRRAAFLAVRAFAGGVWGRRQTRPAPRP
ncbi:DUF1353 domain-containing protein [Rubrivirga litoralis]|uniref:DUF1353 domain-containing protein n=1 Tax=Rubrivirga litoralis TaxID=3075598 RepID=A0ABU3BP29_9BACT|nr:DUF1353 domain-containing protein [Rubrivirga sp. F394]MDT0631029.1 DUF1353 domain-containing protein [Rubrivirga sp. F394]